MANYCTQFSEVIPHLTADEVAWLQRAFGPGGFDKSTRAAWAEEFGALWGEVMGPTFDYAFDEDTESGAHLWVYSEEGGDVDQVIRLVQAFLRKFRPAETWAITWSSTCSKPRVGEFGGGWAVVTAQGANTGDTWMRSAEIAEALGCLLDVAEDVTRCAFVPGLGTKLYFVGEERMAGLEAAVRRFRPQPYHLEGGRKVRDGAGESGGASAAPHPCPYCSTPMGGPELDVDQDGASVAVWRCEQCGAEEHVTRYPPPEGAPEDQEVE